MRKYNSISRVLHGLVAFMILSQYVYGLALLCFGFPSWLRVMASLIESIGITILPLLLFRFIWNIAHSNPSLPKAMSLGEVMLARCCHYGLYLLTAAAVITGALIHYQNDYFFIIPLPEFHLDPTQWQLAYLIHHYIIIILALFIIAHVLAALKHKIIDKDGVWEAML